jgi:hypothetical protein
VKANLGSALEADRLMLPYTSPEIHLLTNGYDEIYQQHMPAQNLARVTMRPGDPDYWAEYADHLPSRAKTRAAANVAIEMESRGEAGTTTELRSILQKVVTLAGAQ